MKKLLLLIPFVLMACIAVAKAQPISPVGPGDTPHPCVAFGTTAGTCLQGAGAAGTPSSITLTNGVGLPYTGVTTSPQFRGTRITSSQSSPTGTPTKVQLNSIGIDTGSYWDAVNFQYKPLVAGTYLACGSVYITGTGLTQVEAAISKNGTTGSGGTEVSDGNQVFSSTSNWSSILPCSLVAMNGSTDTLELDVTAVGTSPVIQSVRSTTQMTIKWVSP